MPAVRRVVLAVLLAALALPASAQAEQYTGQAGAVSATLTWTPPADEGAAPRFDLAVQRAGAFVFDGPLSIDNCAGPSCRPAAASRGDRPFQVVDLDRDGEPEVLLFVYWGGAHCCFLAYVYRYDGATGGYRVKVHQFADAGARLRDLGGDGRVELVSADFRLAYEFASFAGSGMPLRIWRYRAGRFDDVTRSFKPRVRADARRWWRLYRRALRRHGEQLGVLAAWTADQYRLGRRAAALRVLRRERRRGHVPSGRRYVERLDRRLRKLGYLRR